MWTTTCCRSGVGMSLCDAVSASALPPPQPRRSAGRPRAFDRQRAVDVALDLFWRHGFEGTSTSKLTAAMGISPPSLYAAFGSKDGLFDKAKGRIVGSDEYLTKPFSKEELLGTIRQYVRVKV